MYKFFDRFHKCDSDTCALSIAVCCVSIMNDLKDTPFAIQSKFPNQKNGSCYGLKLVAKKKLLNTFFIKL